jgi:hypothetical protein
LFHRLFHCTVPLTRHNTLRDIALNINMRTRPPIFCTHCYCSVAGRFPDRKLLRQSADCPDVVAQQQVPRDECRLQEDLVGRILAGLQQGCGADGNLADHGGVRRRRGRPGAVIARMSAGDISAL